MITDRRCQSEIYNLLAQAGQVQVAAEWTRGSQHAILRPMNAQAREDAHRILRASGMPDDAWVELSHGPDGVRYWDLVGPSPGEAGPVDAVVESGGLAVVYVRTRPITRESEMLRLRRAIALRGDGAALALYEPGRLTVYEPAIDTERRPAPSVTLKGEPGDAGWLLQRVSAPPKPKGLSSRTFLLDLLDGVIKRIVDEPRGMTADDALSFAGRALFVRFLYDRGILTDDRLPGIVPGCADVTELFLDAYRAERTNRWLDTTFNGGLLPWAPGHGTSAWFRSQPAEAFARVSDILRRAPGGQLELPLDWSGLDFAHIPVGLLSEVYEAHAARYLAGARTDSVHYTPGHVADYLVGQCLDALEHPEEAKVLDPAVGGGVFLVSAYRALAAARWRREGQRPGRAALRRILEHQLVGFDINASALRLTMLSLYLTALELDPDPFPPEALKFVGLLGRSIHHVAKPSAADQPDPGSLGPAVGPEHNGQYDVVVGNPPWTAWKAVPAVVRRELGVIQEARIGRALPIKDHAPDLWFVWFATRWARSDGRLAFVLSGRWLFQQSDAACQVRDGVLAGVRATGIVNGAALRSTAFWPGVTAPFSMLLAVNRAAGPDEAFWFVSPSYDPELNRVGQLRLDADAVAVGTLREVAGERYWAKSHFRGVDADRALLKRLLGRWPSLRSWWVDHLGLHADHQGFQVGGAAGKQQDASAFHDLPVLEANARGRMGTFFAVDSSSLPRQWRRTLLFPRSRSIYFAPLVVVPKSIPLDRARGRAARADEDLMYSESFHGWSAAAAPDSALLASYLHLLFHSDVLLYVALLTSAQFGVERDALLLEDIERMPVPPLERISDVDRRAIPQLAERLRRGQPDWAEIDHWVASVYRLSPVDQQTIRDTLNTAVPAAKERSRHATTGAMRVAWCDAVAEVLAPALRGVGRSVSWIAVDPPGLSSWRVLALRTDLGGPRPLVPVAAWLDQADALAATELVVRVEGGLVIARLDQARYWTVTRARGCAARWLRDHGDHLAGRR
jgi:hypothetical protein